ncbi:hypothetical protein CVT24_012462 [Panaeolus cyanescens]|uniref:Uncharacterized protein n=1 Tax=Panaeolus cyanescens TaxID=181874 RepID=A0A409WK93_9AGAR|nr:hypothetical protein CVT24_012462 [Panaeolus cyanescens]
MYVFRSTNGFTVMDRGLLLEARYPLHGCVVFGIFVYFRREQRYRADPAVQSENASNDNPNASNNPQNATDGCDEHVPSVYPPDRRDDGPDSRRRGRHSTPEQNRHHHHQSHRVHRSRNRHLNHSDPIRCQDRGHNAGVNRVHVDHPDRRENRVYHAANHRENVEYRVTERYERRVDLSVNNRRVADGLR